MYKVYGRNNCQWCKAATDLLDRHEVKYEYYNIEEDPKALADFKWIFFGAKTVPQILVTTPNDGDHEYKIIGGYTELVEWRKHFTQSS